jgi:hypothetical protein
MEPINKFLLEVEEMYCPECVNINGHVHTGKYWTCCICGNQLSKKKDKKENLFMRIINYIFE